MFLAASPGVEVINVTAVIVAAVALLGSISTALAPAISKRIRGHSDVREDSTAQNQTLKDAAEVAMKLVEATQLNAAASIDMIKDALGVAKEQLTSANQTIAGLQGIINDLRSDSAEHREQTRASLAQLMAEKERATRERDSFSVKIRSLEAQLKQQTTTGPIKVPVIP